MPSPGFTAANAGRGRSANARDRHGCSTVLAVISACGPETDPHPRQHPGVFVVTPYHRRPRFDLSATERDDHLGGSPLLLEKNYKRDAVPVVARAPTR